MRQLTVSLLFPTQMPSFLHALLRRLTLPLHSVPHLLQSPHSPHVTEGPAVSTDDVVTVVGSDDSVVANGRMGIIIAVAAGAVVVIDAEVVVEEVVVLAAVVVSMVAVPDEIDVLASSSPSVLCSGVSWPDVDSSSQLPNVHRSLLTCDEHV